MGVAWSAGLGVVWEGKATGERSPSSGAIARLRVSWGSDRTGKGERKIWGSIVMTQNGDEV